MSGEIAAIKEKETVMKSRLVIASAIVIAASASTALAATAPGFYHGAQRISPTKIQGAVHRFGAGAIYFVPPPAGNGPVQVSTACGPFKYSFIHTQDPHTKFQIWQNVNGKAMSEEIINACQHGSLTVSFSPVVKK